MRSIYLILFLICLVMTNHNLFAQETVDSLQVQSSDSLGLDLPQVGSSTDYNLFSDSFRLIYSILFFIVAFILSIYLRQPLQKLSERRTKYSHFLKQIVPLLLMVCWFWVIYIIVTEILVLNYISTIS